MASSPTFKCEPTDPVRPPVELSGAQLLPCAWKLTLPEEQHEWVGRALFRRTASGKVVLTTELRLWWYPPGAQLFYIQPPATAHPFFQRPFFLWMPYRMWAFPLRCPTCGGKLMGAGLYKTVRRVLDRSGWYFMGTEYLECGSCHRKVASWSQGILEQLDLAHRRQFPAVLTYKLACDRALVGLLKERTLGNSVSRLRAYLVEQHTEDWMTRSMSYLSVLHKLRALSTAPLPTMHPVPSMSWLSSVYVYEAITRLEETKARVTSIFGEILKIKSTKKVSKKLGGVAAGTADCVTSVGNEYGQVLMCVLTADERDGLTHMAAGLMRRYREAGKAPPKVMYVDQDCCVTVGQSQKSQLFHEWNELVIRLDVWHFEQRFARGVTTVSHQLYSLFMERLSMAIFEWDAGDVTRLREAKQSQEGRRRCADVKLSAKELARHCRRRTRGVAETERVLQEVLDGFWEATDTMGVPLIDHACMEEIWSTQRRHLACIQDPEGVLLYTKTGEITKGGVRLPVYRCARGSTSLESFHLHLCRFIPGTSASDVHFQVYLLEGLVRWNENRGRAAVKGGQRSALRCYSGQLQYAFNQLTQKFYGRTLVENYTQPREYTGELIGVEYLYSQTGAVLQQDVGDPEAPDGTDEDEEVLTDGDDGSEEEPEEIHLLEDLHTLLEAPEPSGVPATATAVAEALTSQSRSTHPPLSQDGNDEPGMEVQQAEEQEEEDDILGPDGQGGYHHVLALAHALAELRCHAFVTQQQAREIVALWQKMSDWDKTPVTPSPHYLGQEAEEISRLVEAIILELCREPTIVTGVQLYHWGAVMREYRQIQNNVLNCPTLMANTRIQLVDISQQTLTQWHNQRRKVKDTIAMAVPGSSTTLMTVEPLLDLQEQPDQHCLPTDASNMAPDCYSLMVASSSAIASSSSSASITTPSVTPSTSATLSASAGVALCTEAATAPAVATATISPAGGLSKTTAWRRRVQQEKERRAQEEGRVLTPVRKLSQFNCRRCGKPKKKEFGHSRYKGESFCSWADGRTVEQWLSEKKQQEGAAAPP